MALGLYISVPFCRTKCSFCNFASDVFSKSAYENYVARLLEDVANSHQLSSDIGCVREEIADSIFLGGGTPSILTPTLIETLQQCGVNRVSLGVQSFVDKEAQSVGRLHKRATVLEEISRLRGAGLVNINVDLIAGLPHQTTESWTYSVSESIATGVPHASIYMLEV